MKSLIVLLTALLALIGAAGADIYSGSGNYNWNGGGVLTGAWSTQTWNSGMALNLYPGVDANGNPTGTPVGTSTVQNSMALAAYQFPTALVAPVSASQSGGNTLYLNNYQEPGTTNPQYLDFQATSASGGRVDYASEGIGDGTVGHGVTYPGLGNWNGLGITDPGFTAISTGTESSTGFLFKNIVVTDTNIVAGSAIPDPIKNAGTGNPIVVDHTPIPTPGDPTTIPSAHIKYGDFNWNCVDGATVKIEDCYTKDRTFTSGVGAGAFAKAEVSPTVNGLTGATAGLTVQEAGYQHISVQVGNP